MRLIPAFVVDRLPLRLWRAGNLRVGNRLHFCVASGQQEGHVRTIEWSGREIGLGRGAVDLDALPLARESSGGKA